MEIRILLKQHIGGFNKPIVSVGDRISKGELIATPDGLGANIHSSFSGVVKEINNSEIKIEIDREQPQDFKKIKEKRDLLQMIKEAGIVGAGGAGFPTDIKLNTQLKGGCVILNACECEPLISHNIKRIEKDPGLIIRGLKYAIDITNADKGYIAIKAKNKKALIALSNEVKDIENIEIKYLPDLYPSGDERVIIKEILGIKLKLGELPSVANAIVLNTETIKNISLAIEKRQPVITKDLTIGGRVNSHEKVLFDVPIGISVENLIEDCGGYIEPYGEILLGGPFTGRAGEKNSPVVKTLGGIFVTMPLPNDNRKFGIIGCECGADTERLKEIVSEMGGKTIAETNCKRMVDVSGRLRCDEPGVCPGQAEQVIKLKKLGAEAIIVGTCEP